jgi:hypothetical protein
MPRKFNVFVDESPNLVSKYPDQFADITSAKDITILRIIYDWTNSLHFSKSFSLTNSYGSMI